MRSSPPFGTWGLDGELRALAGGGSNRTLLLETNSGRFVLKSTRRSEAALQWLGPLWDAAERAGFRVPRYLPSASGELSNHGWTCEPFIDGTAVKDEDLPALLPLITNFHAGSPNCPQRPGFVAAKDLAHILKAGNADLSELSEIQLKAVRHSLKTLPDTPVAPIHGDIHAGNLLRCRDGKIALLDWDEARCDHGFFDFVRCSQNLPETLAQCHAAWEIAVCWHTEPNYAQRLLSQWFDPPEAPIV